MRSTLILYGDSTSATHQAVRVLVASGVPFTVTLFHNATTTPMLGTPVGAIKGLKRICLFAEKAAAGKGETVEGGT